MPANPLSAMLIPIAVLTIVCVLTVGKILMEGTNGYRVIVLALSSAGSIAGVGALVAAARRKQQ